MKFSAKVTVTFLAALLVGHSAWAAQGLVIVEKTTVNGAAETHQIQITQQRMRTDVGGPNGPTTVVFDGTKQVLYHDQHGPQDLQRDDQGRGRADGRAAVGRDGADAGGAEEHAARAACPDGSDDERPRPAREGSARRPRPHTRRAARRRWASGPATSTRCRSTSSGPASCARSARRPWASPPPTSPSRASWRSSCAASCPRAPRRCSRWVAPTRALPACRSKRVATVLGRETISEMTDATPPGHPRRAVHRSGRVHQGSVRRPGPRRGRGRGRGQ